MRLALLVPGFSSSEEDWCIPALWDLVRELRRRHRVDVFALRYPHRRGVYEVHGARVHAFDGREVSGVGRLALLLRVWRYVEDLARRRPFDLFHALWAHEPGFLAVRLGRRLRTPTVVSILGGELVALPEIGYGGRLSWMNRRLVGSALRGADRVTVGSRFLAARVGERLAGTEVSWQPLGVDLSRFSPQGERAALAGDRRLLQVASLSPVKDHATALAAFAGLARERTGLHMHLVGEGAGRADLEELARSLGVGERVHFHGAVEHHRLAAYYRAADLCLQSSRFESQGMVVLEAAACGRVTVGTEVGILPEVLERPMTVPVGDAAALEARLRETLSGDAVRRLGDESRQRVESCFGLQTTVSRLEALYETLARKRSVPADRS